MVVHCHGRAVHVSSSQSVLGLITVDYWLFHFRRFFLTLYVRQDLLSHLGPSPLDLLLKRLTIFNVDMYFCLLEDGYLYAVHAGQQLMSTRM